MEVYHFIITFKMTLSLQLKTTIVQDGEYKMQVTANEGDKFGYDSNDYFTIKNQEEQPENHGKSTE